MQSVGVTCESLGVIGLRAARLECKSQLAGARERPVESFARVAPLSACSVALFSAARVGRLSGNIVVGAVRQY